MLSVVLTQAAIWEFCRKEGWVHLKSQIIIWYIIISHSTDYLLIFNKINSGIGITVIPEIKSNDRKDGSLSQQQNAWRGISYKNCEYESVEREWSKRSGGKRLDYGKWKRWLRWVIPPPRRRLMFTNEFSSFCQSQHCIGNISCQTVHLVCYLVWQRAEGLRGQPPWLSLSNNT